MLGARRAVNGREACCARADQGGARAEGAARGPRVMDPSVSLRGQEVAEVLGTVTWRRARWQLG